MDCEMPGSPYGAPESWELAERAVKGFAEILEKNRLRGTFFVTPESAIQQARLFGQISEMFELGMHFHPFNIPGSKKRFYLGQFVKEEQKKFLKEAKERWSQAIGREPKSFRPGNFSANDITFQVLTELGFRQGSVSTPYRKRPDFFADWESALLDPHHVDASSRLIQGSLEFFEVPVTVDPERKVKPNGCSYELRIEWGDLADHLITVKNTLRRLSRENAEIKSLVVMTHNLLDYSSRTAKEYRTLEELIPCVQNMVLKEGFFLYPTTIAELHRKADCMKTNI